MARVEDRREVAEARALAAIGEALAEIAEADRVEIERATSMFGTLDVVPEAGRRRRARRGRRRSAPRRGPAGRSAATNRKTIPTSRTAARRGRARSGCGSGASFCRGPRAHAFPCAGRASAGKAQLGRGEADIVAVLLQRLLDQLPLDPLEIEVDHARLARGGGAGTGAARLRQSPRESEKSASVKASPSERITARSQAWRSARTLPGQS